MTDSANVEALTKWQQKCVDTAPARLAAEAAQLRALHILDEKNQPTSQDLPEDMQPESTADLTAL